MRRWTTVWIAGVLVLTACGGGGSNQADGDPSTVAEATGAELSVLSDDAEHRAGGDGEFVDAREVEAAEPGDELRTNTAGLVELGWPDGSLTRVGPDSQFAIIDVNGTIELPEIDVSLDIGRTWHRVKQTATDHYEVETGVAVAAVRGTTFSVVCLVADTCVFTVVDGIVAILVDGEEVARLGPGQRLTIGPDGPGEVQQLTVDELFEDEWIGQNLEADGTDSEDLDPQIARGPDDGGGGVAAQGDGDGQPRAPISVRYDYVDVDGTPYDVTLSWAGDGTMSMFVPDQMLWITEASGDQILCDPTQDACYRIPAGSSFPGVGALPMPRWVVFSDDIPGFEIEGEREIAGHSVTCGVASDENGQFVAEACFDDETGVMLSADTAEGAVWEALEVRDPQESDFMPLGPVEDLPSG